VRWTVPGGVGVNEERLKVPVWLLDIDGVLNAATRKPDRNVWPRDQWRPLRVHIRDVSLPVLVAEPVLEFIRRVHDEQRAEIRWHTTWQHDAAALEAACDLPHFPVQPCPEYNDAGWHRAKRWFKLAAAERVLMHECRDLLWTDDDLTWELRRDGRAVELMRQVARVELIAPSELTGLTPKHLRRIGKFLDDCQAPRRAA
jgi:hypothetical protein